MKYTIASVDLGSSLVKVVIGQIYENKIEIIGYGTSISSGISDGEIINIEQVVKAIDAALIEAENIAGVQVSLAIVNISGKNVKSLNSRGTIAISNDDRIITNSDINRVIDNARTIPIDSDYQVLHVLSRDYLVDSKTRVTDPLGMNAFRLEANVHIVITPKIMVSNIFKVINRISLDLEHIIANYLASSESVLKETEKSSGCILIDFGYGVSDVAVFIDGGLYLSFTLPLGSRYLTSDLEYAFGLSKDIAEFVKKTDGLAVLEDIDPLQKIELPSSYGGRKKYVYIKEIVEVLEPRLEEIFGIIYKYIRKKVDIHQISAGVILTGGGSLLNGITRLVERIFNMNVRLGKPLNFYGFGNEISGPEYAVATGMLRFFSKQILGDFKETIEEKKENKGLIEKIKEWITDNM